VPADPGIGLARVVVVAPSRRVDLALPEQVPLGALLPAVLTHAGEEVLDSAGGRGGWTLRRRDGTPLDVGRSAAAQHVVDGDMLFLVLAGVDWPEPEYDDVVDAIAASARSGGVLWSPGISRWVGVAIAGGLVTLAVALCVLRGPSWTAPAVACLELAVGCLFAGTVLARVFGLPAHGLAFCGYAMLPGSVGGLLLLGGSDPLGRFGAPHLLTACLALFVTAMLAQLSGAAQPWLFVAAAALAAFGAATAAAALTPLDPAQAAGGLAAVALLLLPTWPALAVRLGQVPLPVLPRSAADLVRDTPAPPAAAMAAGVARADQWLTGLLAGSTVAAAIGLVVLSPRDGVAAPVLIALVSVLCLIRAPLFPTLRHRLPLLLCGVTGLVALTVATAVAAGGEGLLRAVPVLAAGAAVAAFVGVWYAGRHPSVYLARAGELLELLLLLAVVPVACAVLGLYSYMRGVAG
jgi:type VII secretion integral membrane protein EccD